MDEIHTTIPEQQPIVDTMPTQSAVAPQTTSYHHKKKIGWIIIGIIIVIIALGVWVFIRHKKAASLTPAQTLQALKNTSKPVTTTVPERAATISTLSNHSTTAPVTTQSQLQMLGKLSNSK